MPKSQKNPKIEEKITEAANGKPVRKPVVAMLNFSTSYAYLGSSVTIVYRPQSCPI